MNFIPKCLKFLYCSCKCASKKLDQKIDCENSNGDAHHTNTTEYIHICILNNSWKPGIAFVILAYIHVDVEHKWDDVTH